MRDYTPVPTCEDCRLLGELCGACGILRHGMPDDPGREGECACGCKGSDHLHFNGWCRHADKCGCDEHTPVTYWMRLGSHPGVPMAAVFTLMGAVAGMERGATGALTGAALMSLFWIPVLLTARTQPVSRPARPAMPTGKEGGHG